MRKARVWSAGALLVLSACGGGGDGGGTGPAVFTSLTIAPSSVSLPVNGTQPLTATARDQNGAAMGGLSVTYQSSDNTRATVTAGGLVTAVALGTATITATGTVGTVTQTRTVPVTIAAPSPNATVAATGNSLFEPPTVVIVPGGTVTWTFAIEHNVTFGSSAPTGGNIPNTSTGQVTRTFPNAGTYNYSCTIHPGMSGTVTVQ